MFALRRKLVIVAFLALGAPLAERAIAKEYSAEEHGTALKEGASWSSLTTATQLLQELGNNTRILLIDVRRAEEYAAGHIPGAISIPGGQWRTANAKPGEGDSQYLFRNSENLVDVPRYEALLSGAGVRQDHDIVVYGSHAGRADGSVPAMILLALGHERVRFLDGIGTAEWEKAGGKLSTDVTKLPPSSYKASLKEGFLWNLEDVIAGVGSPDVVFYDTRSAGEFLGEDLRGNARGGHIPGAVCLDYDLFLEKENRRTLGRAEIAALLEEHQITPDKRVVLYCQTATRVSLPYLVLKDLGFTNVSVYDASWHEYGNRTDTPIAGEKAESNQ